MNLGFTDKLFDYDHDGKLSWLEKSMKYAVIAATLEEMEEEEKSKKEAITFADTVSSDAPSKNDDEDFLECDPFIFDKPSKKPSEDPSEEHEWASFELSMADLDEDELRDMSTWDRDEALIEAGLNPLDYDYLDEF